jgi:glycyl-tRNA synthetase beta chain
MPELLLEVGCEEIPATSVERAFLQLRDEVASRLDAERLAHGEARAYGTPRRLIVVVPDVAERQPDVAKEQRGPRVASAYDESGEPTKALLGFCRGQGVEPSEVRTEGEYVWATKEIAGRAALEVLSEMLAEAIRSLTFDKTMRWGEGRMRFARPVRWILALLGGEVVPFEIEGVPSGSTTRGHRFLAPDAIAVQGFQGYSEALRRAFVEFEPERRRERILQGAAAAAGDGKVDADEAVVDENVYLTEWPTASTGTFDRSFLNLPPDVLAVAMKKYLKFLPVIDAAGNLINRFISIRNGGDEPTVIQGNEWVLAARFNDAKFFFDEDAKHPLGWFADRLERIVFQEKLGSVRQKAERLAALAERIARSLGLDEKEIGYARRAAELAKADLASGLVQELPGLQGIIGGEYARRDGEAEEVCEAIRTHYAPEAPPDTAGARLARILMAADRIDTLAGYLGLGLVPSGSKDPFGLRRAVHLLIENGRSWGTAFPHIRPLLEWALREYRAQGHRFEPGPVTDSLAEIARGRYELVHAELRHDVRDAVLGAGWEDAFRVAVRSELLHARSMEPGFVPYVRAATRAGNIVTAAQKKGIPIPVPPVEDAGSVLERVDAGLFEHEAEGRLLDAARGLVDRAVDLDHGSAYEELWALLGGALTQPLAHFFDNVMVMVEDERRRDNRLTMLSAIASMYLCIADFSKIVIEGA